MADQANTILQFTVHAVPVSQPRVKATRRGAHAGVYTPTKTASGRSNGVAELKAQIRIAAAQKMTGGLLTGPLSMTVVFTFPRQRSKVWKKRDMPRYWHVVKPDLDNVWKLVKDALKGVVWVDDSQVCDGHLCKMHCRGGEAPSIDVEIVALEEAQ